MRVLTQPSQTVLDRCVIPPHHGPSRRRTEEGITHGHHECVLSMHVITGDIGQMPEGHVWINALDRPEDRLSRTLELDAQNLVFRPEKLKGVRPC